ncbi:MAG: nucleoside deaminase [Nocardioides sp.]|nr:nucleoside deaminase [Nocardioides sp.]
MTDGDRVASGVVVPPGYGAQVDETDLQHLRRCVELAAAAVEAGDEPFGSVLVSASGDVLREDRNRETSAGDPTAHPEIELARWAGTHLSPAERGAATVYTSGEHCPMCAAAHAWVGLGRIVFASSSAQTAQWLGEMGVPAAPVLPLPIEQVAPHVGTEGPSTELAPLVHELHRRHRERLQA